MRQTFVQPDNPRVRRRLANASKLIARAQAEEPVYQLYLLDVAEALLSQAVSDLSALRARAHNRVASVQVAVADSVSKLDMNEARATQVFIPWGRAAFWTRRLRKPTAAPSGVRDESDTHNADRTASSPPSTVRSRPSR